MRSEQVAQIPQPQLEKIFLSWNDVHSMLKEVHKFILSSTFLPDTVVTLHKGGIIPATILSYMLKIPDVHTLKVIDGKVSYAKDIVELENKSVLLVENVIETGRQDLIAAKFLKNVNVRSIMVVTVIQKESDTHYLTPHYAAKNISKDEWAVFPWEALDY